MKIFEISRNLTFGAFFRIRLVLVQDGNIGNKPFFQFRKALFIFDCFGLGFGHHFLPTCRQFRYITETCRIFSVFPTYTWKHTVPAQIFRVLFTSGKTPSLAPPVFPIPPAAAGEADRYRVSADQRAWAGSFVKSFSTVSPVAERSRSQVLLGLTGGLEEFGPVDMQEGKVGHCVSVFEERTNVVYAASLSFIYSP